MYVHATLQVSSANSLFGQKTKSKKNMLYKSIFKYSLNQQNKF